jgi:divalent metal cation (Fe/Co/Zn/Cd) transporter
MTGEGALGLLAGFTAGSIALIGWAFGSVVEGLASGVVIWRFSGSRMPSDTAERRAKRAVAISFWLLAPYITAQAVIDLVSRHHPATTALGLVVAGASLIVMPGLGAAKHRLGGRLGSAATTGEGTQNYICAAQAAAVLLVLAVTAAWPAGWWVDPVIAMGLAVWSVREGAGAWRGDACC